MLRSAATLLAPTTHHCECLGARARFAHGGAGRAEDARVGELAEMTCTVAQPTQPALATCSVQPSVAHVTTGTVYAKL